MKLLFYIKQLGGGGAERVMAMLINGLIERGYQIALATNTEMLSGHNAYHIDPRVELYNLHQGIPAIEKTALDKVKRYCRFLINERSIARKARPDIVISFLTDLNHDVIFALLGLKLPIICSEHTNVLVKIDKKTSICRELMYPLADAITVLTRHDYLLWKNKKNIVRMPNPCYCSGIAHNIYREKVVLAVGSVHRWNIKGFDNLIRSWSRICHKFPEWRLQIAGGGPDEDFKFLDRQVKELNCINVDFLGFRTDVSNVMSRSAIYVLSSRYEGLPMSLIEAMDAGCCCVSFDVQTGPRDIIKNGYDGVLVKNQNIEAMAEALSYVISNDEVRTLMSQRAPISIKRFDIYRVLDRWEILFRKVQKR